MKTIILTAVVRSKDLPAEKIASEVLRIVQTNFLIKNGLKMQGVEVVSIEAEDAE